MRVITFAARKLSDDEALDPELSLEHDLVP